MTPEDIAENFTDGHGQKECAEAIRQLVTEEVERLRLALLDIESMAKSPCQNANDRAAREAIYYRAQRALRNGMWLPSGK